MLRARDYPSITKLTCFPKNPHVDKRGQGYLNRRLTQGDFERVVLRAKVPYNRPEAHGEFFKVSHGDAALVNQI